MSARPRASAATGWTALTESLRRGFAIGPSAPLVAAVAVERRRRASAEAAREFLAEVVGLRQQPRGRRQLARVTAAAELTQQLSAHTDVRGARGARGCSQAQQPSRQL